MDVGVAIGYGTEGNPEFWIIRARGHRAQPRDALRLPGRRASRRCGPSTPRRSSSAPSRCTSRGCGRSTTPHYYGAFVRDPDGNNVEAVFHAAAPDA